MFIFFVHSKSLKSINYFSSFLTYYCKNNIKHFIIFKKTEKLNKRKISLLKSPHVHKTAQEQFNQINYKQIFLIIVPNTIKLKLILIFKKWFCLSFYETIYKLKFFIFSFRILTKIIKLFNYNLNSRNKKYSNKFYFKNNFCLNFKKIKIYNFLKFLNLNGIFILKSYTP